MQAATFCCNVCKIKFQLIGISAAKNPEHCPYCEKGSITILMSAFNFEEDEKFQKYMKDGVIDSTIEKPVTIHRLYQRVTDELQVYQSPKNLK